LAHEAGVNRAYLSKIEIGGTWVGLEIIDKLASALEVEPAEFLGPPPTRRTRK
jgi:transcriptional regulator with XRE-family HTH domain